MKFKLLCFLILFTVASISLAQKNDFFNLNEVKKLRFDKLEIFNQKEANQFIKNRENYNFITTLKVSQVEQVADILNALSSFPELTELNLLDYKGEFKPHVFDSCSHLETLHIKLNESNNEALKEVSKIKNLQTLYLYLEGKFEDYEFLNNLPQCKEIHLIGEMLPKDIKHAIGIVNKNINLQVFGISVDRITDIGESIKELRLIHTLVLYDNLSIFTNKGIEDLTFEQLSINYLLYDDLYSAVRVLYYSDGDKLSDFEKMHLGAIYNSKMEEIPYMATEMEDQNDTFIPFVSKFHPAYSDVPEYRYIYQSLKPIPEQFIIQPHTDAHIITTSGMELFIAKNSFIKADNTPVNENIYLKIIQMNKPEELMFSGFNNRFGDQYLNANFTFSIQATTSDNELKLKEGYQMKVLLPVKKDSAIEHYFDYESNTWQNLNLYNQAFSNSFEPIDFYQMEKGSNVSRYYQFDSSNFETRFNQGGHYYLNDEDENNQLLYKANKWYTTLERDWSTEFNKDRKLKGFKLKKGKALVKISKVIPKKRNNSRQYFKLLDKTEEGLFSELKAFKNINFNVMIDAENKKALNDGYIKNKKYQDVRVIYNQGDLECIIKLKSQNGYKILKALITDSDIKKNKVKQVSKFSKAYNKYIKLLNEKGKSFDVENEKRQLDYENYLLNKKSQLMKSNSATELKINQLGSFGFYYYITPQHNTNIIAQYTNDKGIPIDVKDLYLIDTRYNTCFKIQVGNLSLTPSSTKMIVAVDYDGELYYANKSDVLAMNLVDNSLVFIKLRPVKEKLNNIQGFIQLVK